MSQNKPLPSVIRVAFLVHLIVAVLLGLGLLLIPDTVGGWFGYPPAGELAPIVRAYGAIILAFGGLTSLYGFLSKSWGRIAVVVYGEIAYLALQTAVFVISVLTGVGPALGNWLCAAISAVLLVLFIAAFVSRPK